MCSSEGMLAAAASLTTEHLNSKRFLVRRGNAGGFAQCRFIPTAEEMALGSYCADGEGTS